MAEVGDVAEAAKVKTLKERLQENYEAGSKSVKKTVNDLIIGKDTLSGTFYNMVNVSWASEELKGYILNLNVF